MKRRGKTGQYTGQNVQDKPWRHEELRRCEEALPRFKESDLENASRKYKAKTGLGCDGLPRLKEGAQKVHLYVTKETRGGIVEFVENVEQSGQWPQQACTTMFFLIPKNVTSDRPIALMPTLIRWWEAVRAPEDGRHGGAQQTVWEIRMERLDGKAKEEDQGALASVLDLAKAFERVSFPVVWAWATHFNFSRKILRVLCGFFEHQRRVQFEGCAAQPLRTITAILPGPSGVVCCCALCCRMH